jgi:hypothetical protein
VRALAGVAGACIIAGLTDGTVRIYEPPASLSAPAASDASAPVADDADEEEVAEEGVVLREIRAHRGPVRGLWVDGTLQRVITAGHDGMVRCSLFSCCRERERERGSDGV